MAGCVLFIGPTNEPFAQRNRGLSYVRYNALGYGALESGVLGQDCGRPEGSSVHFDLRESAGHRVLASLVTNPTL